MKQIPYGIDDYDRLITKGYYYIDKTRYIETVEMQASYILFVRPRRMGKSLFVNMLMSYYDIAKADRFDQLFGHLWIGKHKTEEANSFLVLKFDFSKVGGTVDTLEEHFTRYCNLKIKDFFVRYNNYFTPDEIEYTMSLNDVSAEITCIIDMAKVKKLQTYLFIDEYDNFSNTVLSARGAKAHEAITHGEGFYRDFFKSCKGAFERIFMTGVAPVTYDDLTSGFNIADVVALYPEFDKVMGVTETELRQMIEYYRSEGRITRPTDDIVAEMKPWYDNFCFCELCYGIEPPIYNTDMVMRYIKSLALNGNPPMQMLDTNARTDYSKLNYLVMAEDLENRERRIEIIKHICAKGHIIGHVNEQFPASQCGDEENFKSMLYYFGTLTFAGHTDEGPILQVPNKTMGELYLQYMLMVIDKEGMPIDKEWQALQSNILDAALKHQWQDMIEKVGELYNQYSSLRNSIRSEADIQGFIRGLLCLNKSYDIWPELELGNGYCDVLLVPQATPLCRNKYSYLLEIKYMKASETDVDSYIRQACDQLDRYVADKHLSVSPLLRGTHLTKLYLVFQGQRLIAWGESA